MNRYYLEFILNANDISDQMLRDALMEFSEGLEIHQILSGNADQGQYFKINMYTQDPKIIFDICLQFGRIKSVKVEEEPRSSIL
ncbi:MAG: hypothetical protein NC908_02650 [Candidatus Omnitrophica bacterium]|nr:hypothetical protein [Candidatus Omnitrophota bacterium]